MCIVTGPGSTPVASFLVAPVLLMLAAAGCTPDSDAQSSLEFPAPAAADKDVGVTYAPAREPIARAKALTGPAQDGQWSAVQSWPLIPIHAVLTPDGRVLTFGTTLEGIQSAFFHYDLWTPSLGFGPESHLTLPNTTGTDIFCASQIVLPQATGQILINGGDNWTGNTTTNTGNNRSTLLDYRSNTLTRGPDMNRPRWYSTVTTLIDGRAYVQGGVGGEDFPEIREADGTFHLLQGIDSRSLGSSWPRNFVMPDGRIFGFGVNGALYWVDPAGAGSLTRVGSLPAGNRGTQGSAAMFRPGHIVALGGSAAISTLIDASRDDVPVVTDGAPLSSLRLNVTATILADGTVLATGGSDEYNQLIGVNTIAERFDPRTGLWLQGASGALARLYHSSALLLPDATVMVAGGGAPGPLANRNIEIYRPPYLFDAQGNPAVRPRILAAPSTVSVGRSFAFTMENGAAVSRVTLVKGGSTTHGLNMDQRFLEMPFRNEGGGVAVDMPHQAGAVPPGYYLLFAFDARGVPSVARPVWIGVAGGDPASGLTLQRPDDRTDEGLVPLSLALSAFDPQGGPLRFAVGGLPPGLQLDPASGLIQGIATQAGTFYVSVSVSSGGRSATQRFVWTIRSTTPVVIDPQAPPAPVRTNSLVSYTSAVTGASLEYSWSFGDGTTPSAYSTDPHASHIYTAPGIFTVVTAIRDASGAIRHDSFRQVVHLPPTASRPTMSAPLLYERRTGTPRLWVVNPDHNTVGVLDATRGTLIAEITVGASPRALAMDAAGYVWVANRRGASISILDSGTLALNRTLNLARGSQPSGIAMTPAGDTAYVALAARGQFQRLRTATFAKSTVLDLAPDVRGVSVSADGRAAWVSRYISPPAPGEGGTLVQTQVNGTPVGGQLIRVRLDTMTNAGTTTLRFGALPDFEDQGRGVPNYLGPIALSPDGTQGFVPSKQDNIQRGLARDGNPLNAENTVRAIASRVRLDTAAEDPPARIDLDNASLASAAVFDRLGVYLFVALETSREVAIYDAHRRMELLRLDVGRAPQGLTISDDGNTLFAWNFMDRSVSAFDIAPLSAGDLNVRPLGTWPTASAERLSPTVLAGKQLFYDARDPRLSFDRYLSCATCHEDGGHDGRVWDLTSLGEGLRNTIALRGRGGMGQGWQHWSGNFDETQDFESQIRRLAGGHGLMDDATYFTGTRQAALGDPKAGLSADLDALAAYLATLTTFDDDPYRASASSLTAVAATGKTLFGTQGCGTCHGTAAFTSSGPATLFDIGTLRPSSGQRLGAPLTGIDLPTLRDVWSTPPYLHDGSAGSIEQAIAAHRGLNVSQTELAALATYVREIGREEAAPVLPAGTGTGLVGQYFNNVALQGTPALQRSEKVDASWSGSPGPGVAADAFSVRWTGTLVPALSGRYRFQVLSNDGLRLWIDDALVVDDWAPHASTRTTTTASMLLFGAAAVKVRIEYFDVSGNATARFKWLTPGASSYVAVPLDRLYPD